MDGQENSHGVGVLFIEFPKGHRGNNLKSSWGRGGVNMMAEGKRSLGKGSGVDGSTGGGHVSIRKQIRCEHPYKLSSLDCFNIVQRQLIIGLGDALFAGSHFFFLQIVDSDSHGKDEVSSCFGN